MKTFDPKWRLGLERMYPLLAELGHPETGLDIVQVAGTNGKGSAAYLTAGLISAVTKRPVGLYTSPHLERLAERFQLIDKGVRREFPADQIDRALRRVAAAADRLPSALGALTEFEAWTLAAAMLFKEAGVTNAVFEVGLGGRLDATTALPAKLAVICPISYDHLDRLGTDLTSIAGEKAAIIRPGQPVVVSEQEDEATAVIRARAGEMEARVISVAGRYRPVAYEPTGTRFTWQTSSGETCSFTLGLLGEQQVMNAACALAVIEEQFGPTATAEPRTLGRLRAFLAEASWPGRFEVLRVGDCQIVLDVGHNPQAIRRFLANLALYFPDIPKWGLYGTLRDKDYHTAVSLISRHPFSGLVLTEPWSERGLGVADLQEAFPQNMRLTAEVDLEKAVDRGLELARVEGALLAVFGSFFVVGPARSKLRIGTAR